MRTSLHSCYPGIGALPRVELCELPTPLEAITEQSLAAGCGTLWVKRDDLTSSVYGGNKVRKLEFLLGDAVVKGAKSVITFGAYGSNHALATAVHARRLGLEPHVILSPQEPGPYAARTLRAHAGLGTVIHVIEGWDGKRAAVEARRELTERDEVEPAVIPMGGTSALGAIGYVDAAFELFGQTLGRLAAGEDAPPMPDVVYVAGGTLGTAVGLAVGFAALEVPTRVVSVRVTPLEVASAEIAATLIDELVAKLREHDATFPELAGDDVALELRDDWFEPGYGVPTPETLNAVSSAEEAGLHLETTYTGKALAALRADAAAGSLGDKAVLFLDTYNSAPYPEPGDDAKLPEALRHYVAECDRLFGAV